MRARIKRRPYLLILWFFFTIVFFSLPFAYEQEVSYFSEDYEYALFLGKFSIQENKGFQFYCVFDQNSYSKPSGFTYRDWSTDLHLRFRVKLRNLFGKPRIDSGGGYSIPLGWPVGLACLGFTAAFWRPIKTTKPGHCLECDYNLTGITNGRCPECGAFSLCIQLYPAHFNKEPFSRL